MVEASQIKGAKSIFVGLIYVAIGSAAFIGAHFYKMGTLLQMGPGYFPAVVGAILLLLGIGSVVAGLREKKPDPITKIKLEPLVLIFAGVVGFAVLIDRAGLVIAIAVLMFFSCLRRLVSNPLEVLIIFVVLAAFSVAVFMYGLDMQMKAFWWQQ